VRSKVIQVLALFGVMVVLLSMTGLAEAQQRRRALVIGNAAYPTMPLTNPLHDAEDVTATLRELGFSVQFRSDATGAVMRAAVQEFAGGLQRNDLAVVYYSGHGFSSRGRNFLLGVDAGQSADDLLNRSGLPVEWALNEIAGHGVTGLIFFDACRNVSEDTEFARSLSRGGGRTAMAEMRAPANMLLAFSTQPGNTASDGRGRNSPFTGALVRYLRRAGAEVREVLQLVRQQVLADTTGAQTPWDHSSLVARVVLASGSASLPAQSCSLLGTLRSVAGGAETEVTFVNRTRGDIQFAFVGGNGEAREAVTIQRGRQRRQRTNAGALWRVSNAQGECRGLYVATPEAAVVNVDE
jgi:hypothetical protein